MTFLDDVVVVSNRATWRNFKYRTIFQIDISSKKFVRNIKKKNCQTNIEIKMSHVSYYISEHFLEQKSISIVSIGKQSKNNTLFFNKITTENCSNLTEYS